ncbi:MAG: hypothetical protein AAFV71_29245 [Cyanobacteria bacterium J06633_8]
MSIDEVFDSYPIQRFVPADLIAQINELGDIEDMSGLKQLHKQAVTINSLEEFDQILPKS